MSEVAREIARAGARPRTSIVPTMLNWAAGIALRLVMVSVVIALVRSPPSALH